MPLILCCFFLISGCATYQSKVSPARENLVNGDCTTALKQLEELSKQEDGDQLVYLMDYGSALQICGDYKKSNQVFLQAERLSDAVDYHSVSRVAGATLFNEEMIQYKGDTFEKLFLNVSLALNFIQLGQLDEAMVEVRKINIKFNKYKLDDKQSFELNSFSKYLAGLIYEADKAYDDACIAYREAFFLDQGYKQVGEDMLRACWRARRTDEFNTLAKKMSATSEQIAEAKNMSSTEAIFIFMQGWGPRKGARPGAPTFPRLVPTYSQTSRLKVDVMGDENSVKFSFESEPVYSFEKAAINTLEADYGNLVARRIGARVAKEVVADQIRQKNQALGAVAWVAMVASERADLRQWSIYPKTMHVLRVPLKPGKESLKLSGISSAGAASEQYADQNFSIQSGQKKLFMVRSLR
jgi:uncharacterized protein